MLTIASSAPPHASSSPLRRGGPIEEKEEPSARSITQFGQTHVEEYEVKVLAIDVSGNQTLSEMAFSTR